LVYFLNIVKIVGIEKLMELVIEILEWKSDTNVEVVVLLGLHGIGKKTLFDVIFAQLNVGP
jgi:hypothetical protein